MQNKITREDIAKKISEEFGIPYTLAYKKIKKSEGKPRFFLS